MGNENHISDDFQTFGANSENINDSITEDSHKNDTYMHELNERGHDSDIVSHRDNNIEQSINDSISNTDGSEPPNSCSGDNKQFFTFTNQINGETMGKIIMLMNMKCLQKIQ